MNTKKMKIAAATIAASVGISVFAADTMLPFEKYVNWGYSDAVKGDVKGNENAPGQGWTDEGPHQDARNFPFDQKTFAGVPFHIVNEKTNGGKGVFTFRGWQCNNRFIDATVPLEAPAEAQYLYLLHCCCWLQDPKNVATITVFGEGGKKHAIELDPNKDLQNWWSWKERIIDKPNAVIGAWFDMPLGNAAVYVSKFALPGGFGKVTKVNFHKNPGSGTTWIVCAATVSDKDYPVKAETIFYTKPDETWRAMKVTEPYGKPGTALDFSKVIPTVPVEKRGRVLADKTGTLHFEKTGEKARFFVCTCVMEDVLDKKGCTKKDVDDMLDKMRMAGYNAQRFWTTSTWFDPEDKKITPEDMAHRQDMFCYMIKGCRDRGIYTHLSLHGVAYEKLLTTEGATGLPIWKAAVEKLMNTVNPYTNIKIVDDESIYCVDLNNELEFAHMRGKGLAQMPLDKYTEMELQVTKDEADFVRSLGYKGMIANFLTSCSCRYDAIRWKLCDFVSRNLYYQHPPEWTSTIHSSSVKYGAGHYRSAFITHEYTKPIIISEHGYPYPQQWRHDQAFVDGAYAALNGFSGLTAFRSPLGVKVEEGATAFMMTNDPILRSSEYLKALMFVREDVAEAPCTVRFAASADEDLKKGFEDSPSGEPYYAGFVCKAMTDYTTNPKQKNEVIIQRAGSAKAKTNIGATNIVGGGGDAGAAIQALKDAKLLPANNKTDAEKGVWESVTGELCLDQPNKRLTVNTPRMQGFSAFAGDHYKFSDCAIKNLTKDAAVAITSIDGMKSIKEAKRLLLVFATNAINSDAIYTNRYKVQLKPKMGWPKQLGHAPLLIETGSAEFALKNVNAAKFKLWALDVDGTRLEEIPLTVKKGGVTFTIDQRKLKNPTVYFELAEK